MAAIQKLIDLKADVNAKDTKGATAVDYASKKGFQEAGEFIAEAQGIAFDASKVKEQEAAPAYTISPTATKTTTAIGVATVSDGEACG